MNLFRKHSTLALLACVLMLPSVGHAADSSLLYEGDFESGDLATWELVKSNVPEVQAKKVRSGNFALKTTLNFYNGDGASPSLRERAEVRPKTPATKVGDEYWYGFSIYLPGSADGADNYVADKFWEKVTQWWAPIDSDVEKGRNPPLALSTSAKGIGGRWYVGGKWSAKAINATDDYDGTFLTDLGPYETGKWTDWVFRVKWSYLNDGILEVWKDGKKVISRVNMPIGFNDQKGPVFKLGLYKGQWEHEPADGSTLDAVSRRVLYHDQFRMADASGSYATVAPSGGSAPPVPPPPVPPSEFQVR